jgi:hypothetical protein
MSLTVKRQSLTEVMQVNGGVSIKETVIMITVTLPKGVQ